MILQLYGSLQQIVAGNKDQARLCVIGEDQSINQSISLSHSAISVEGICFVIVSKNGGRERDERSGHVLLLSFSSPPSISSQFASQYRLAVCALEKNFSTLITNILCYLSSESDFTGNGRSLVKETFKTRSVFLDFGTFELRGSEDSAASG